MIADSNLVLSFTARQRTGRVAVDISQNLDPASVGCSTAALNFPICRARVEFDADGYNALLGWIQLVRMRPVGDDSTNEYVMDPLQIYEGLETPFGFYGIRPDLFDAPSRSDRSRSLDWFAESFLCVAPSHPMAREACPVIGFSWGFTIHEGAVEIREPQALSHATWRKHLEPLRHQYPSWTFYDSNGWPDQAD